MSPQGQDLGRPRFRLDPAENGVGKTQSVSEGKDEAGIPARRRREARATAERNWI